MSYNLSQVCILKFINIFGTAVIATKVYCSMLANVAYVYSIALSQATQIMVGYLIGAGDLEKVMGLLYGGQNYKYNFHFQTYDFKRIEYLLTNAGFSKISRYDWCDFLPENFDDFSRAYLPHMDFEHGRLMSLNIIAIKDIESEV